MERTVKDKIIVVTGGANGIGLSIADKCIENEAKTTIILDIDEAGNAVANNLNDKYGKDRAVFIKCDVTKDLEKVSSEIISVYKTVDVLFNNAGWVKEDSIKDTLNLNVVALVEWSMKFFEHMRIDKGGNGGTIVNMSSLCGFQTEPYVPFYTASKHAVLGFTKSKGHVQNYASTGVRMVAICPGLTRTTLADRTQQIIACQGFKEYVQKLPSQDPDAVGEAAMEIVRIAESGTAWLIEGGTLSQLKS